MIILSYLAKGKLLLYALAVQLFFAVPSFAQEKVSVAVAANYIQVFKELAMTFEARTGLKVEATYASSGTLYSQIMNGAPYDLYLSADEDRPGRLYKEGRAEKPFVYAQGRLVLWSAGKDFCRAEDWRQSLQRKSDGKIAIANPLTAPYGVAAKSVLEDARLWDALQSRLVFAQDIAQAFQYAFKGAVEAAFCSFSSVLEDKSGKGCCYAIGNAAPIIQSACLLKGRNTKGVDSLARFIVSPDTGRLKEKYGYK